MEKNKSCPCGSGQKFENCCDRFISGSEICRTAEELMRSRYSAYTMAEMGYIKKTLAPEALKGFNLASSKKWATESEWMGLKILKTENGTEQDRKGVVEFVATFKADGDVIEHHEVAQFRKNVNGEWLFVDGDSHTHKEGEGHHHHEKPQTFVRESPKVGRNEPCTCGSGKKFKKCCGNSVSATE